MCLDKKYCVYLVKYIGDLLPKYYIGSTSVEKVLSGKYFGSVRSKKWREIFKSELSNNPKLFTIEILSEHITRTDALERELEIQLINNVVKSDQYMNESFAIKNGMFGRDVSGKLNPMYGKKRLDSSIRMTGENNIAKRIDVREKLKLSKIGYKPVLKSHSIETKMLMREIALNRSDEVKENIKRARRISNSIEKAQLERKNSVEKKYETFILKMINELEKENGSLEIGEIYKIFNNESIKFIKSGIVFMKKRKLIFSIPRGCKSICVLSKS